MRNGTLLKIAIGLAAAVCMGLVVPGHPTESPALASDGSTPTWNGSFRQDSGAHDLRLQRLDPQATQVDLVKANQPWESEGAHFYALIMGDTAEFKKENCQVSLTWVDGGVEIQDHCNGKAETNGLYRKLGAEVRD